MTFIQQISVFVENKSGRLAQITRLLGDSGINIRALSIADTTDFGILRLIVDDPARAEAALKTANLTVKTTDVIGITVAHTPGGLAKALNVLSDGQIAIEYMYAFTGNSPKTNGAMVILRVDRQDKALAALQQAGIEILDQEAVQNLT